MVYKVVSTKYLEKYNVSTFEVCRVSKDCELSYSEDIFKVLKELLLELKAAYGHSLWNVEILPHVFLDGYRFLEKIFEEYGFEFEKAIVERVKGFGIKEKVKLGPIIKLRIEDIKKLKMMVEDLLLEGKYKDEIIVFDDLFLTFRAIDKSYEMTLFHNSWGGGIKG
ncbi:MAG: hypothetical protein DRO04_01670, partial [Candidatus Iainarchaeum archaeon]